MEYRVEIDVYNGPLDLLLYLIKRDELDITDIPIARITESYMQYVEMLKHMGTDGGLDINVAGDFLVMAATLMEIKSSMLLPKAAPAERDSQQTSAVQDLTDPRYELVQQLLEYKRFKDTAAMLERQQHLHENRFPHHPAKLQGNADEPPPLDLEEVQIWDLLDAFSRLMRELGFRKPREHEIIYDDTPIDLHEADIEDRLAREGRLTLRALFLGRRSRSELIGLFLALLELIREKKVLVHQSEIHGEIEIEPAPEEHRRLHSPPPMHLADETEERQAPEEAAEPEGTAADADFADEDEDKSA